jgi:GMP synthase (glutamine-hydrolysing)
VAADPHFLVIDGYTKAGRDDLEAGGATTAGVLYRAMLERWAPGCTVDILHPTDPGSTLPTGADLGSYDGLAWTGSSLTIWKSDDPNVAPQLELMKAAFEASIPSFGSCWAAQIGVVAAGGRCVAHPWGREMGIARKIRLTDVGRGHPMYVGKPTVFDAFISHDDEVTHLPPGAECLASNAYTRLQAVSVHHRGGLLWAVQYHPEYDLHELARLTHCRTDKLVGLGFFQGPADARVYIDDLEALHADPSRKDLAWRLGIDADVMSPDVRQIEVRNWIEQLVRPAMRR